MYKSNDVISGRYQIIKEIGTGGMSDVYIAYDKILEVDIAIKVLSKSEDTYVTRFRREAEIIAKLDDPNIVKIFDFNVDDTGHHYIVMEYVNGMTIKEYIKKYGKMTPQKAMDVVMQILEGLSHAHDNQIIHRDIKSQNIMITQDNKVKIMDFGIAKMTQGSEYTLTNDGSVLGTTYYIAPEFLTKGNPSIKSDIYSLGIVMFEMLTGQVPYKGDSFESICLQHLKSKLPSVLEKNQDVSQAMENVIIRATAKKSENRYIDAIDMEKDLMSSLDLERADEEKLIIEDDISDSFEETAIYDASKVYKVDDMEKDHKQNKSKKKRNIIIISSLSVGLIAILAFFTFRTTTLVMPDVTGMTEEEAIAQLAMLEIVNYEVQYIEDDAIPEGVVVKTNPTPNSSISKEDKVTLYVSAGVGAVTLDDYVGLSYEAIVEDLENQGFTVEVEMQESEKPTNTIIEQYPASGNEVLPGEDTITLYVSAGISSITMNNLIGLTEAEAVAWATENNIVVQKTYKCNDSFVKGTVYDQSPAYGTEINSGDTITIYISDGACNTVTTP